MRHRLMMCSDIAGCGVVVGAKMHAAASTLRRFDELRKQYSTVCAKKGSGSSAISSSSSVPGFEVMFVFKPLKCFDQDIDLEGCIHLGKCHDKAAWEKSVTLVQERADKALKRS